MLRRLKNLQEYYDHEQKNDVRAHDGSRELNVN